MPLVSSLLDAVVGRGGVDVPNLGSENTSLCGLIRPRQPRFVLYELCCRFHLKMLSCGNAGYLNHQINFHGLLLKKMDPTWK